MAKQIDTTRARCDTCGKPYKLGDALYSIASKLNEERDVLLSFRHAACDIPIEKLIDNVRDASKRLEARARSYYDRRT